MRTDIFPGIGRTKRLFLILAVFGLCLIKCAENSKPGVVSAPDPGGIPAGDSAACSFDDGFLSLLYTGRQEADVPVCGATYYVDATSGDDTKDGLSEARAWKTLARVNASSFSPGDCVLFKRGGTWQGERLIVPSSGAAGLPITFSAYGAGAKPVFNASGPVPGWDASVSWTSHATNVWYLICDDDPNLSPKRIWLSGGEAMRARELAGISSATPWFYDNDASRLYVHATANPAVAYTSIVQGGIQDTAILVAGRDYVTLQNLDARGGRSASIGVYGSDHVIIEACDVGWGSDVNGITAAEKPWTPADPDSNYGIVRWCLIDSGHRLAYPYDKPYPEDGIGMIDSASRWEIYANEVKDWGHTAINLSQGKSGGSVSHNRIYSNLASAANVSYCRGFGTIGLEDGCRDNVLEYNIIRNTTVRNQLGGNNNLFRYNVIDTVRNSVIRDWGTGQGVLLTHSGYADPFVCHDNVVSNNIIYNTDEPGIMIQAYSNAFTITGNEVSNNIILNSGNSSKDGHTGHGLLVLDQASLTGNSLRNNVIYKAEVAEIVDYHGLTYNAGDFNKVVSAFGDVISGNVQLDPLLSAPEHGDFRLAATSPCKK